MDYEILSEFLIFILLIMVLLFCYVLYRLEIKIDHTPVDNTVENCGKPVDKL
jgi:hypothetical protein